MAKLHFKYGAMNSGKTTILIQTAYNYEERGQKVFLLKPKIDSKAKDKVMSRIGAVRRVDLLVNSNDKILVILKDQLNDLDCILVDEAQFLTKEQIDELFYITKIYNVPVIAYGLRTDFRKEAFPGSERLLELADSLEEIATICVCGKKARFNARKINDKFICSGDQVLIDGSDSKVEYISLCGKCYIEKVQKGEVNL